MGGIATRTLRVFKQFCGVTALRNVVIVTNMWGKVTPEEGMTRERQLQDDDRYFKPLLTANATMQRHDNTLESARQIIRRISFCYPSALDIQTETVDQNKDLPFTSAGITLQTQLLEPAEGLQLMVDSVWKALKTAIDEQDRMRAMRLEEELHEKVPRLARLRNEITNMEALVDEVDVLQEWNSMNVRARITTLLRRSYGKKDTREKNAFWAAMGDTIKLVREIYTFFEEHPLSFSVQEQLLDVHAILNKADKEKFDSWLSVHRVSVREMETTMDNAIAAVTKPSKRKHRTFRRFMRDLFTKH